MMRNRKVIRVEESRHQKVPKPSWLIHGFYSITLADLPIQLRSWPLFSSFSWNLEPSSCFRMLPIVDWPLGFLQTTLLWCHRPKWRRPEWSKPRTPVKKCSKPSNPWWKGFDSKRNRKLKMRCWIGFSIPQLLCRFFWISSKKVEVSSV